MATPGVGDWRERILVGVGVKPTAENLRFFDAWARAEGGTATNNPFNTTQKMPGSTFYNQLGGGIGVQNYQTPQVGIDATVNTLTNGRYGNIIGALRKGDSAMRAAQALANSPWGTGALTMKVLGSNAPAATAPPQTPTGGAPVPQLATRTGGSPAPQVGGGGQATLPNPARQLGMSLQQILSQATPSPSAVRLLSRLGPLSAQAAKQASTSPLGDYDPNEIPPPASAEPIHKTVGVLQTGSTSSKYKTIDLGKDFDGPAHPNVKPIVGMAMQYLGTPYLWGGADPRKGFDCSGFVQYLYAQAGIKIGRSTYDQVKDGQPVRDMKNLQPGDIVLFSKDGDVHHEGLYIGGGQFIHAPHTGDVVKISNLSDPYYKSQFYVGRRIIGAPDPPPAPKA
jgi:cell wall-associated NlpC family hydrolase